MDASDIYRSYVEDFQRRKFVGGLLPAIIDFLLDLGLPRDDIGSFEDLRRVFPQQAETASGRTANTLILKRPDGSTLSIRPFYNGVERFYRAEEHRHDYPSCAPHATQAWPNYVKWIDGLVQLSAEELQELRARVVEHVLGELPSQEFDPNTVRAEPPAFRKILEEFDFVAPSGEPSGAAFQGAVFGFIRADNPHLQVEIEKVRTGSSRLQRVGDIDAWDGRQLAVTAEVKFRAISVDDVPDISNFVNSVNVRGAIGLVIAQDMTEEAQRTLLERGVQPLTVESLIRIVELWDPAKQRIAVRSFVYYAHHVEKNSVLANRLDAFVDAMESLEQRSDEAGSSAS